MSQVVVLIVLLQLFNWWDTLKKMYCLQKVPPIVFLMSHCFWIGSYRLSSHLFQYTSTYISVDLLAKVAAHESHIIPFLHTSGRKRVDCSHVVKSYWAKKFQSIKLCSMYYHNLVSIGFLLFHVDSLAMLQRQAVDGGFQGRPNKPTDTCYAFW